MPPTPHAKQTRKKRMKVGGGRAMASTTQEKKKERRKQREQEEKEREKEEKGSPLNVVMALPSCNGLLLLRFLLNLEIYTPT
jgi:hypothetical protein